MGGDVLLAVRDVAEILQCSPDYVVKKFAREPGVIDMGRPESRKHRRYRILRIPKSTVEKYLSARAGRPVTVTVPLRPERRRRSPDWERRAILILAKSGLQNGPCEDRATFLRIASRARLLVAHVDPRRWHEIFWEFDGED